MFLYSMHAYPPSKNPLPHVTDGLFNLQTVNYFSNNVIAVKKVFTVEQSRNRIDSYIGITESPKPIPKIDEDNKDPMSFGPRIS